MDNLNLLWGEHRILQWLSARPEHFLAQMKPGRWMSGGHRVSSRAAARLERMGFIAKQESGSYGEVRYDLTSQGFAALTERAEIYIC